MKISKLIKKNFRKIFSLPISLRATLKLSLRSRFSGKKHFFVFCRKFGFNHEKSSNHCSQLQKHLNVDAETRSCDILTKTHEKIPTIPNIAEVQTTLENRMIHSIFWDGPQICDISVHRIFFASFRQKVIRSCFWVNFYLFFQLDILVWQFFKVKTEFSTKNEKVFFR